MAQVFKYRLSTQRILLFNPLLRRINGPFFFDYDREGIENETIKGMYRQ
jgi:hypothetical protein